MDYAYKIKFHINKLRKTTRLIVPKLQLRRHIKRFGKIELNSDTNIVVTMLCGKKTIYEGIASLLSFYSSTQKNYALYIFDDGSLDAQAAGQLSRYFSNYQIIWRKDSDKLAETYLLSHGFDKLLYLRKKLVFASRLTDVNLYLEGKTIIQLDSDVLTLQRPVELLEIAEQGQHPWAFNKDVADAYCLTRQEIRERTGIDILETFNAGLCMFPADKRHLTFFEANLRNILTDQLYYTEQTLMALLMTVNHGQTLPQDYDLGFRCYDSPQVTPLDVKTRHYCGYSREYFYPHFRALTTKYQ